MAMGTMGRGSRSAAAMLLCLLLMACSPLHSLGATHAVGDSQGWGFSVSYDSWAKANTFVAGDSLVFNYQAGQHNVVPVSAAGYRSCNAPASSSTAATSGKDRFALKKGANYFICSIPGHCAAGMKIQVIAN